MSLPSQAVVNIGKRTERMLLIAGVITILGIALSAILLMLANQQVKKITTLKIELDNLQSSQQTNLGLQNFVQANLDQINDLVQVFPSETTIIDFVSRIESLVVAIDPEGEMNFSTLDPVKQKTELLIPFTIQLSATYAQVLELLKQIETLPYIISITKVDSRLPQGLNGQGEFTIGGIVYVQDPFR
jgi:Tfp pilus assembly protein PilO